MAAALTVNNDVYNQLGATWWDDNAVLGTLRVNLNPVGSSTFAESCRNPYAVTYVARQCSMSVAVVACLRKSSPALAVR